VASDRRLAARKDRWGLDLLLITQHLPLATVEVASGSKIVVRDQQDRTNRFSVCRSFLATRHSSLATSHFTWRVATHLARDRAAARPVDPTKVCDLCVTDYRIDKEPNTKPTRRRARREAGPEGGRCWSWSLPARGRGREQRTRPRPAVGAGAVDGISPARSFEDAVQP
jgi:hypothetical protein